MTAVCRRICGHADGPRRPPLPLLRVPALSPGRAAHTRPPRVRHTAGGGLRAGQAARHGLRHDHRPRHDRRRARDRGSPRRVRVRGADRLVQGRAAGRARALLGHHAGRSRVAPAQLERRGAVRRVPARLRDRVRARAPLLRGRRAARGAPPPPARPAVQRLGDAQRLARARIEPAGRHLHRDPRRCRGRRIGRPRRGRRRAHMDGDAARVDPGTVSTAAAPRRGDRPRRAGQRREVGARRDGAGGARARPWPRRRPEPARGASRWPSG